MSFILDALRKSDAERQRTATPGLADARYARRPARRNIWLPILVVVLLVNLVFMGVQWFGRRGEPPAPATAESRDHAAPATSTRDAGAALSNTQPPDGAASTGGSTDVAPTAGNVRPLARENEFDELRPAYTTGQGAAPVAATTPPVAATAAPAAPSSPAATAASTPAMAATPGSTTTDQYPRITPAKGLPSIEQVIGEGKLGIPMLNLDLHVYSNTPANRFVVINSHRYREGDRLAEGPLLESITADGVILDSNGLRFTLARK